MKHIEFADLEQRPGTHVVPVQMTREELEAAAQSMADLNAGIEAKEDDLRSYSKDVREEIKELEEQRSAVTRTYRFKRDPKSVTGLWGFDFEDHGRVKCRTCLERAAKLDAGKEDEAALIEEAGLAYDTEGALAALHKKRRSDHPALSVWERPLGTKWFVEPKSGDVFGPVAVVERDLQLPLQKPETRDVPPFALQFDGDTAIPLLDPEQVSVAEKKLKETDDELAPPPGAAPGDDYHDVHDCGLPVAWHDQNSDDPCKAAMVRAGEEKKKAEAPPPEVKKKRTRKPKKATGGEAAP